MNHFVHCSFSTSNKITSKGCQSASQTCDFDAKNAKLFWGEGTAPCPSPSPSGHPIPTPHSPRRLRRLDLNPPILKFCLRYWIESRCVAVGLCVCPFPKMVWFTSSTAQNVPTPRAGSPVVPRSFSCFRFDFSSRSACCMLRKETSLLLHRLLELF